MLGLKTEELDHSCGKTVYTRHLTMSDMHSGLQSGTLLSGNIHINPKCFKESYVKHPVGDADIFIPGLTARNRALSNDTVAVKINSKGLWRVFDHYIDKDTLTNVKNNRDGGMKIRHVTLAELVDNSPSLLNQYLGAKLTEMIINNLDSSCDPQIDELDGDSESSSEDFIPWWSVIQRTGVVVGIIQPLHSRAFIGHMQMNIPRHSSESDKSKQNDYSVVNSVQDSPSKISGNINRATRSNWRHATIYPTDSRLPHVIIPKEACPENFRTNPTSFANVLFVGVITEWSDDSIFPKGKVLRTVYLDADSLIENQTDRILVEAGFTLGTKSVNVFPDDVTDSLTNSIKFDQSYLNHRVDFRSECVFTIDPDGARDLDDALHIRNLTDNEIMQLTSEGINDAFYEVGIHIADVSYYVKPNSSVDKEAAKRATTIYLVQLCVPMLPRLLCEDLASLNPGEDKLTFSVVFIVSRTAHILKTWFGRTIIRSCCKMSYDDAQTFIDKPNEDHCGIVSINVEKPHSLSTICQSVLNLNNLADQMRRRRFHSGALSLNQVKSSFVLDEQSGQPISVALKLRKSSNWLVEEWMLAANQAVAGRLASYLPDTAFLRRHPPPCMRRLSAATKSLNSFGVLVSTESAGEIQASICREAGCPIEVGYSHSQSLISLCENFASTMDQSELLEFDNLSLESIIPGKTIVEEAKLLAMLSLLAKTMNLAVYFCMGALAPNVLASHYALNFDLYTHFTSPIRRYADIIVHRQLAATLAQDALKENNDDKAAWYMTTIIPDNVTVDDLQRQAEICNSKKLCARWASEESAGLYFTLFVKETGPLTEACVVTSVLDHAFDVLILAFGISHRIYCKNSDLEAYEFVPRKVITGKLVESEKLILVWNTESGDNDDVDVNGNPIRRTRSKDDTHLSCTDRDEIIASSNCSCDFTEIKLFNVVRCSIGINSECTSSNSTLPPKLLVKLLRNTCEKCSFTQGLHRASPR